jgi:hypothetical protein
MDQQLDRIEARVERMESKMDNFLERQAVTETLVANQSGQIRLILAGIGAVFMAAISYVLSLFGGK